MEIASNPVFHPSQPTKILISPGHGAGYVSWAPRGSSDAFLVWMLTYEPLITGLEEHLSRDKLEDIMTQFHLEAKAKFGIDRIYTARVSDLFIETVDTPFEIREYDGHESIVDVSRRREIALPVPPKGREEEGGVVVSTVPPAIVSTRVVGGSASVEGKSLPPDGVPKAATVRQGSAAKSSTGQGGK